MASGLDMSLDDIIKTNKSSGRGGGGGSYRGRGGRFGGGGGGPARRFPNRAPIRAAPYPYNPAMAPMRAPDLTWGHDMILDQVSAPASIETGTKLYISNLDYNVSNDDIKELFSEVGDLKRYSIHYDRSGRSKGTAEVVYSRRIDALAAVKRYNNVQLDGKPMKIELVGTNMSVPGAGLLPPPPVVGGAFINPAVFPRSGPGRSENMGRGRGGRGFGRGRGRGSGNGNGSGRVNKEKVSAEDLDAELDKYHEEAMQTN